MPPASLRRQWTWRDLALALDWLRGKPGADAAGFVWLHFNLSEASAEAWIRQNLAVVPEFFDAMREGSRSTRIEDAHDTLVAIVNDVAYEFAFDASEIETLRVNVTPRMAISARIHPLRSIDRLRQAVKDGARFDSSVAFLNHLLHDQGDVLVRIVREATHTNRPTHAHRSRRCRDHVPPGQVQWPTPARGVGSSAFLLDELLAWNLEYMVCLHPRQLQLAPRS